ncbi:fatty acid elongase, partial [Pseudoloma neurophilia]
FLITPLKMDLSILEQSIYNFTIDWRTPVFISILYLTYVKHMNPKYEKNVPKKRDIFSFTTFIMAFHNLILAIFSMYVFSQTGPFIYKRFKSVNYQTFCLDPENIIRNHIEYYSWLFYISKLYEIVDTFIVHLNGKPSIFLQYFHHTGAIFATYLFSISKSHIPWIFVVLNSFIHSIMYLYYFLSVFRIRLGIKKIITGMQMTQFIVGYLLLGWHFYHGFYFSQEPKLFKIQVSAIIFNVSYVLVLFILFKAFFEKTYQKKPIPEPVVSEPVVGSGVVGS